MAKRFTDTNKWHDPWFSELSPSDKLLWFYLTDNCNQVGVIDFSKRMADFMTGSDIDIEQFIVDAKGRLKRLENGKILLTKFLLFQNGRISVKCPAHKPIIRLLEENVELVSLLQNTLSDTLLNTLSNRVQVKGIVKVIVKEEVKVEEKVEVIVKESIYDFSQFWTAYEKKGNKKTSEQRYSKIKESDRELIKSNVSKYVSSTPDKQFRKNAETWLNQEGWNDEVVDKNKRVEDVDQFSNDIGLTKFEPVTPEQLKEFDDLPFG
jgi:hypothetical protein